MPATVREFWERAVARTPDALFVVHGEDRWTFAEFDASCRRVADGLVAAGIGAGERLAYQLPHGLALLRLEMAAQLVGAVTVPLIPGSTAAETAYVVGHCEPRMLITTGAEAARDAEGVEVLLVPETDGDLGPLEADRFPDDGGPASTSAERGGLGTSSRPAMAGSPPDAGGPAMAVRPGQPGGPAMSIRYTSGSTGRPKGVVQPARGFATAGGAIAERLGLTSADVVLCVLPLFHVAASHMLLAPAIAAGCPIVVLPRFSRTTFWDDVRRTGATVTLLMPTQMSILMTAPPLLDDAANPLRICFSHIRPEEFCERFAVDVCTTWAMTETSGMGTLSAPGTTRYPPKVIGRPVPDDAEIRVCGPDGEPLPPGELGELCFRHPDVMIEYFRDPATTAATLRDGWVRSGDLCAMDEAGNAYFHGRLKNVIKRGGENVAGEEVEFTIMEHPAVEECLVTGVEDPIYTEEVAAVVVVREGHALTEDDVVAWCAQRLSAWKVPRYLHLRGAALPKLANGKTDRGAVTRDVAAFTGGLRDLAGAPSRSR